MFEPQTNKQRDKKNTTKKIAEINNVFRIDLRNLAPTRNLNFCDFSQSDEILRFFSDIWCNHPIERLNWDRPILVSLVNMGSVISFHCEYAVRAGICTSAIKPMLNNWTSSQKSSQMHLCVRKTKISYEKMKVFRPVFQFNSVSV